MKIKRTAFLAIGLLALSLLAFVSMPLIQPANAFSVENFDADTKLSQADQTGEYNFDKAHTFIGFRIKHMGLIEVPGYFRDFTGTVNYDAADVKKSTVNFTAKMTSVDTGVAPRDNHLRTKDFFEVETYPEMTFKSTKVEKKGKNFIVTGDLTMKGVTKQISLPFQLAGFSVDAKGGQKMGITAETVINRRDFNVNYDSKLPNGTPAVADQVTITLQIEAANKQAPKAAGE
jgi:polyisoprenoid-binding protein YceI